MEEAAMREIVDDLIEPPLVEQEVPDSPKSSMDSQTTKNYHSFKLKQSETTSITHSQSLQSLLTCQTRSSDEFAKQHKKLSKIRSIEQLQNRSHEFIRHDRRASRKNSGSEGGHSLSQMFNQNNHQLDSSIESQNNKYTSILSSSEVLDAEEMMKETNKSLNCSATNSINGIVKSSSSSSSTGSDKNNSMNTSNLSSVNSSDDRREAVSVDESKQHHQQHHHQQIQQQPQQQANCTKSLSNNNKATTTTNNSESDYGKLKDQINMLKYELKEKDMDIVELQKEINELQLENKMFKSKISLLDDQMLLSLSEEELQQMDSSNPFMKEYIAMKRERDCAVEELLKARDVVSKLQLEQSAKNIECFESTSSIDVLHKKLKAYERRVEELEDDNEKYVCEIGRLQGNLDQYKMEYTDLKARLNETRIYKEREDQLLVELANLKNDLQKQLSMNEKLAQENACLLDSINSKCISRELQALSESVTVSTQTVSYAQESSYYSPATPKYQSSTQNTREQPYRYQNSNNNSNNLDLHPSSRVYNIQQNPIQQNTYHQQNGYSHGFKPSGHKLEDEETSLDSFTEQQQNSYQIPFVKSYGCSLISKNSDLNSSTSSSRKRHDVTSSIELNKYPRVYTSTTTNANGARNDYNPFSKNDDYLVNNFRPFSTNSDKPKPVVNSSSGNNNSNATSRFYRHLSNYVTDLTSNITASKLAPYVSSDKNSKFANLINNQNSSSNSNNRPGSNNPIYSLNKSKTTNNMRSSNNASEPPSGPTNTLPYSSNHTYTGYSRSNCSHYTGHSDDSDLNNDETGSFRTTASSTRNKSSVSVPCRASKSLRISVMRDIKSAQKLKTALLKSKSDDEFKSFGSKQSYTMGRPDEKPTTTATASDLATRTYLKTHSAQKYLAEYDKIHASSSNNPLSDSMSSGSSKKDNELEYESSKSFYRSKSADRAPQERRAISNTNSYKEDDLVNFKDIIARKRPFVPLRPDDIRSGDFIKFSRPGGKISRGLVKYIGPLPNRHDVYFGLELDSEEGKHDGTYQNHRYFQTKPNKGVFVSFSKVVMAWG